MPCREAKAANPTQTVAVIANAIMPDRSLSRTGKVLRSASLHTDDTSVVLLAPRRTAHAWVYIGDAANPYIVFDLSVGRSGEA